MVAVFGEGDSYFAELAEDIRPVRPLDGLDTCCRLAFQSGPATGTSDRHSGDRRFATGRET